MATPQQPLHITGHDLIVVGASAGGVEALKTLVGGLPVDLPAAVLIVLHLAADGPSFLPEILSLAGPLPASHPLDGEAITPGHIFVALPDHHLPVEPGHVRVTRGPKENRVRPAIDALFRSAAYAYGPRVIGVVLTGLLDDGTAGLWAVKDRGGLAVVQDPLEAFAPSMPNSALRQVAIDHCLPLAALAPILAQLAKAPAPTEGDYPVSKQLALETRMAMGDQPLTMKMLEVGAPSPYTCPECHGSLVQLQEGDVTRYRCHTGHAYALRSLLAHLMESLEATLWSTLRTMHEQLVVLRQVAQQARDQQEGEVAEGAERHARQAEQSAQVIHALLRHQEDRRDAQRHAEAG